MPWFNVDDGFAFHRKAVRAGNAALGLWVRAGSWCAQQLTDGYVPNEIAEVLGSASQAQRLVSAGLWSAVEGGYQFHEWTENGRNPSRSDVLLRRKKDADKKARARASKSTTPQVDEDHPPGTPKGQGGGLPGGVGATTPLPSQTEEDSLRSSSSPRKRGTRLPEGFSVTAEMVEWARENAPNVDGRRATASFVDYWRGRTGRGATKLDWPATWRNWMRREQEKAEQQRPAARLAGLRPSSTDRAVAQAELLKSNPNPAVLAAGGFAPPSPPGVEGPGLMLLPGGMD